MVLDIAKLIVELAQAADEADSYIAFDDDGVPQPIEADKMDDFILAVAQLVNTAHELVSK